MMSFVQRAIDWGFIIDCQTENLQQAADFWAAGLGKADALRDISV
jgi:hypothetical protein